MASSSSFTTETLADTLKVLRNDYDWVFNNRALGFKIIPLTQANACHKNKPQQIKNKIADAETQPRNWFFCHVAPDQHQFTHDICFSDIITQ